MAARRPVASPAAIPVRPLADADRARALSTIEKDMNMKITKAGTSKSVSAPAEHFTGQVRVETVFSTEEPARSKGAYVTFEPGARTNWHTHPLGQTLIITHGSGRVQSWGGQVQVVNVGDVIFFEPGEKHWHGGGLDSAMTHLTIGESLAGKSADWLERVTDDQYNG
jgi:quercetin dioxygenase-like cupin family protein